MTPGTHVRLTPMARLLWADLADKTGTVVAVASPRVQVTWHNASMTTWLPITGLEITNA